MWWNDLGMYAPLKSSVSTPKCIARNALLRFAVTNRSKNVIYHAVAAFSLIHGLPEYEQVTSVCLHL